MQSLIVLGWVNKPFTNRLKVPLRGPPVCRLEKNLSDKGFLIEALKIKKLCQKYQVPLIINDNVEVAIKCDADGVHVGQQDMQAERKFASL